MAAAHFLPAVDVTLGGTLTRVAAADVDGDGKTDLAVLSQTEQRVVVLPGEGTGRSRPRASTYTGAEPVDLAFTDFNRDGRMDRRRLSPSFKGQGRDPLLGADPSPTSVLLDVSAVLLDAEPASHDDRHREPAGVTGWISFYDGATPIGSAPVSTGQATFQTRLLGLRHALAARGVSPAVASRMAPASLLRRHIRWPPSSVFAFGPPVRVSPGATRLVAQADFNADGIVDLATYSGGLVTVLLGQGNGQFSAVASYSAQAAPDCWQRTSIWTARPTSSCTPTTISGETGMERWWR